jgi:hypothetical protein
MSQAIATTPDTTTTACPSYCTTNHPTCPDWCHTHWDGDDEYEAPDKQNRNHRAGSTSIFYPHPDEPDLLPREAVVELARFDVAEQTGVPVVHVGAMHQVWENGRWSHRRVLGGLDWDDPLGLADAERLAHAILDAVATGRKAVTQ